MTNLYYVYSVVFLGSLGILLSLVNYLGII